MANWKGKTRGGLLGYQIFVFLIRYAGLRAAYSLLLFVAFYFVFFSPTASRSIYSFFRKRLGKGLLTSLWGIYRTYWAFGQALIDRTAVLAGFSNKFTYDFDGEPHIHEMAEAGKGGVLLSIHGGNWSMAGSMLEENVGHSARINIVMLEAEHKKIQAFLKNIQVKQAANIIGIGEDFSHIIAMGSALRQGELLCMHGDRFLPGAATIEVDFLGATAHFPAGPFQLISRMKVPYSFVFAFKEKSSHYHFYATPVQQEPITPQAAAQQFAQEVETQLQKYPYQWYNFYDFWATPSTTKKTNLQTSNE
jgi:predicted LPLAT superfamily acyltransferase